MNKEKLLYLNPLLWIVAFAVFVVELFDVIRGKDQFEDVMEKYRRAADEQKEEQF